MFEELLRRLRGGRRRFPVKRSPEEILRSCKRQPKFEEPQEFEVEFLDPPDSGMFVLDIKDEGDMNDYISKLNDLKGFNKFRYNLSLNWLRTRFSEN